MCGFHYIRAHFSCMEEIARKLEQLNLMIWCSSHYAKHVWWTCTMWWKQRKERRRRKSNLLKKQFWELPTPPPPSNSLCLILHWNYPIGKERALHFTAQKEHNPVSQEKKNFLHWDWNIVWFQPYHGQKSLASKLTWEFIGDVVVDFHQRK